MKHFILFFLYCYKFVISPILRPILGHGCRFQPTCSEYSIDTIKRYGIIKGIPLSLRRLATCHS